MVEYTLLHFIRKILLYIRVINIIDILSFKLIISCGEYQHLFRDIIWQKTHSCTVTSSVLYTYVYGCDHCKYNSSYSVIAKANIIPMKSIQTHDPYDSNLPANTAPDW